MSDALGRPEIHDSQARLEELGYKQELHRHIPTLGNVALSMSNVSPTMATFIFALAPLAVTGTATAGGAILLSIAVVFIGLCLGELGSVYPVAGGLYSLVRFVLPRPLAFLAVVNFLLQALIFPPGIALGVATYLQLLLPALPQGSLANSTIAAVALVAALLIGLRDIRTNAIITGSFLTLELVVLAVFTYGGFANPRQDLSTVIFSPMVLEDGVLAAVGFVTVLTAIGVTFGVINGYDASLGFSEETQGSSRNVAKAVVISATLTGITITVPLLAAMVGAPNLQEFLSAESPLMYTATNSLGPWATSLMEAGIIIAAFNALILIIMYMARVLFTTGRDEVWPDAVNWALTRVTGRTRVPWVSTAIIAVVSGVLVYASTLVALITFVGVLVATVYLLVGIAVIYSRMRDPHIERPFRVPLFPLPPIVVMLVTVAAIVTQRPQDILLAAGIGVLALIYYFTYARRREMRRRTVSPGPALKKDEEPPSTGQAA